MSEISDDVFAVDATAANRAQADEAVGYEDNSELTMPGGVAEAGRKIDALRPDDEADAEFGTLEETDDARLVPEVHAEREEDGDRGAVDKARQNVDSAFERPAADDAVEAVPPDGGDGGHEDDGSSESGDDDEENLRQAYSRFRGNIATLKSSVAELEDPTTHPDYVGRAGTAERPGGMTFRVGDSSDPSGEKNFETRIVPDDDELRAAERSRYDALLRARRIDDPVVRADLQQIEAFGAEDEQIVTRVVPGDKVDDLMSNDKRDITDENIRGTLRTVEAMVAHGLVPNQDYGDSVVVHPETHRLQFQDFSRIEDADVDADRPILATADSFIGVTTRLYEPGARDRETREASDRFQESGQHALKDHLLYKRPYIAYTPEEMDPDAIRALYAHTAPTRSSTTHDLHIASSMHELALQGQGQDLQARLDALGDAREAYEIVVFQQIFDRRGDLHQVLREDERGRNPLLINDHFLQARMALACWPASEARVRGEDLPLEQREEINQNLSEVIQQMMPGDEPPRASHERETSFSGFLTEAVAMTALSRVSPEIDSALALPTSEVQRLYGGPDAMIIFSDEDGEAALDEDWKLTGNGSPDTVNVGSICYGIAAKLEDKPYKDDDRRTQKVWKSVVHVAKLLRDEGLNRRVLTVDERSILDQVQGEIWGTITGKAYEQLGIDDLRGRARF